MRTLKIDAKTSIHDLAVFINQAGNSSRIRAKTENNLTVLYESKHSLLNILKENFISKFHKQAKMHSELAKKTIGRIISEKSDRGGRLEHAIIDIQKNLLNNRHEIIASKIRDQIYELDTSTGVFKITRNDVCSAWHACLDQFILADKIPLWEGLQKLEAIGSMSDEDAEILKDIMIKDNKERKPEEIKESINALRHCFQSLNNQKAANGINYKSVKDLARTLHTAIELGKAYGTLKKEDLERLENEPLKTARLFFSKVYDRTITPLNINISRDTETDEGKKWINYLNELMSPPKNLSKESALKAIALENLEHRDHYPNEQIQFFQPENVAKSEIITAFTDALNEHRGFQFS